MMEKPTLFNFIKDLVSNVRKKNQEDPKVETAPPAVFDRMTKEAEEVASNQASTSDGDLIEMLRKKMDKIQQENEANPEEATADKSVFHDILNQLDNARESGSLNTVAGTAMPNASYTEVTPPVETPAPEVSYTEVTPPTSNAADLSEGTMAMINSMGGSLGLRGAPDMGSPEKHFRLPDSALVKVLEYSDKSIILDGVKARWVRVTFEGNTGWTLESYLNFN